MKLMNNQLENFYNDFLENGYYISNIENLSFLEKLKSQLLNQLNCENLELLHKSIDYKEINNEKYQLQTPQGI